MKTIKRIFTIIKLSVLGLFALAAGLFVGLGAIKSHSDAAPNVSQAPWLIQTSSLAYYAKVVSNSGTGPTITGYWTENGSKWTYHAGSLSFSVSLYGPVQIEPRK
jgi:hypothetical protein